MLSDSFNVQLFMDSIGLLQYCLILNVDDEVSSLNISCIVDKMSCTADKMYLPLVCEKNPMPKIIILFIVVRWRSG